MRLRSTCKKSGKKRLLALGLGTWFMLLSLPLTRGDDVPVAPIEQTPWKRWSDAIVLKNTRLEVVIVPSLGRLAFFAAPGEENLLRFMEPPEGGASDWFDIGGSWLYPVAQQSWPLLQEKKWPPPAVIDAPTWKARAWKSSDGSQRCVLEATFGAPLHLICKRTFRLAADESAIQMDQTITRLGPSEVPVVLWNTSQVDHAERVVMPLAAKTAFADGVQQVFGDVPARDGLTHCGDDLLVCRVGKLTEVKLGSDSAIQWIAATSGPRMMLQQVLTVQGRKGYPDGGCTLEAHIDPGLGYADIELLSPEMVLPVGHTAQNQVRLSLHHIDPSLDDCALAKTARGLLAERKEVPGR